MKLKLLYEQTVPQGTNGTISPEDATRMGDVDEQQAEYKEQASQETAAAAKELERLSKNLKMMGNKQKAGTQSKNDTYNAALGLEKVADDLIGKGKIHEIVATGIAATQPRTSKEPETTQKTGGLGIGAAPGT